MDCLLENTDNSKVSLRDKERHSEYQTIGQLSSRYGLSLRTLRFYEDRGMLSPLRHGTMRLYDGRQRSRLEMILKGKRLGFTLAEIRELLGTRAREEPAEIETVLDPQQISSQIDLLERQRAGLDAAIRELRETHQRVAVTPVQASCNTAA